MVLTSPSPNFGGWSGLVLDDDAKSLLAISDTGVWMTGTIAYDGMHPFWHRRRPSRTVAEPRGHCDQPGPRPGFWNPSRLKAAHLSKGPSSSLSKAVTASSDMPYRLTGFLGRSRQRTAASPRPGGCVPNQGLEGMTVMKGGPYKGSLVAFSERLYDLSRNHTGWLWTKKGPATVHLKNIGDYDITDLSSLDDGTLFVLERRFRWTEGVKMRLRRIIAR